MSHDLEAKPAPKQAQNLEHLSEIHRNPLKAIEILDPTDPTDPTTSKAYCFEILFHPSRRAVVQVLFVHLQGLQAEGSELRA